jgi:alkylation response protein AidB-like acyl-CoA dehydrogenase
MTGMITTTTSDHIEIRNLARAFLADRAPLAQTRQFLDVGFDSGAWRMLGKQLGLQGLALPEEYGGTGLGPVELAVVLEEMGRVLYSGPYFSSIVLAAHVLLTAGSAGQRTAHLPALADGSAIAALAFTEPGGPWDGAKAATTWRGEDRRYLLSGTKTLVINGADSDLLIVTAAESGGPASALTFYLVRPDAPGTVVRRLPSFDQTRGLAAIELNDAEGELLGEPGGAGPLLATTLRRAAILLAAEQLGAARRCLEMSVEYAGMRTQFGRAIGSFQAIKHRCADMLLDVETAASAVSLALAELTVGFDIAEAASLARSHCSDVLTRVATGTVHVHGGIGFTWEHDAHLYLKRAKSSEQLLGSPAEHRELLGRAIGL